MIRIIVLLVIFWQPVYELWFDPLQLPMPRRGFDRLPFDRLRDRGSDRVGLPSLSRDTHQECLP